MCSSCAYPTSGYSTYTVPGSVSAGVAWTNASYDASGFPIFGYSYGRPVYGYTAAGEAIFTIAALTALCFVPHWGPAGWYRGHYHYPHGIHRVPAPPRFPAGHAPGIRPPQGITPPPAPNHRPNASPLPGARPPFSGMPMQPGGHGGFHRPPVAAAGPAFRPGAQVNGAQRLPNGAVRFARPAGPQLPTTIVGHSQPGNASVNRGISTMPMPVGGRGWSHRPLASSFGSAPRPSSGMTASRPPANGSFHFARPSGSPFASAMAGRSQTGNSSANRGISTMPMRSPVTTSFRSPSGSSGSDGARREGFAPHSAASHLSHRSGGGNFPKPH